MDAVTKMRWGTLRSCRLLMLRQQDRQLSLFSDYRSLMPPLRVVSGTHKFDRGLSRLLHTELQWLNVPERVAFKLGLMVFIVSAQPSIPVPR